MIRHRGHYADTIRLEDGSVKVLARVQVIKQEQIKSYMYLIHLFPGYSSVC